MITNQNRIFYFILFLFTLSACETENLFNENDIEEVPVSDVHIERLSLEMLLLDNEIGELKTVLKENYNVNNKNVDEENWVEISKNLKISAFEINRTQYNQTVSWTFKTKTNLISNSSFENFLVKKYQDKFSYYLVSYIENNLEENDFKYKAYLFPIPEESIKLNNLNLSANHYFDWAPNDGGGGCQGDGRWELVEKCDRWGSHQPKYCCQHSGGIHGCGSNPCNETCSGTKWEYVIDFSHCGDGYTPPENPTYPSGGGDDYNPPTGGTSTGNNDSGANNNSGGEVLTTPTFNDNTTAPGIVNEVLGFNQNSAEAKWVSNPINSKTIEEIAKILGREGHSKESIDAATLTIRAAEKNLMNSPYSSRYLNEVYCCGPDLITNVTLGINYYKYIEMEVAIIKAQYPANYNFSQWELAKIYMEANLDAFQFGLDLIGLIPAFGEIADVSNGIIYTIRGDAANATLSYASATPIAGWFASGTRIGFKVVNVASDIASRQTLKWVVKGNGLIGFGNRYQLAKVLKTSGTSKHAHHIIPWAFRESPIVQKAAKSKHAFHMNENINGIPLDSKSHLTGHNSIGGYNDTIGEIFLENERIIENMNSDEAYNFLIGLTNHLRDLIEANPTKNLGEIADLINYP